MPPLLQQRAGNDHHLHFAGALVDLSDLGITHHALDGIVTGVAVTAEQLQAAAGHIACGAGCNQLCLSSLDAVADLCTIHSFLLLQSGSVDQILCSLDTGLHLGQLELGVLESGDAAAELLTLLDVSDGLLQSALGDAQSLGSDTDTAAIQELMSRVSAGNKPFKGIEPTLTETENDMANENKTQGFEYGAIAASLGMKDGEVKDVMARISELAAMEPKYREIQKSLSDAQTVIAGKDASIRNLQTDLAAATARLSAYEQKEKDEQASRIETLVENAIAEGKIDREAKTQWVEMAGSNSELEESTLASIPAREKISKEIADDPANIQATAEATKTAEQLMAEKVAEVVGADFKFRKL